MRRGSVWGKFLFVLAGCGLAAVIGAGNADAARKGSDSQRGTQVTRSVKAKPATTRRVASAAPSVRRVSAATAAGRGKAVASRSVRGSAKAGGGGRHLVASKQMSRSEMKAVASGTCLRRDARGNCTGARLASFASSARAATPRRSVWHAGLPAPDAEQMACPEGTLATLARGHTDTVRCMPL